jgi:hypothetical protein
MATTYTEENPYRISSSDALYPSIYIHHVKAMKTHMAVGPMWILVLGVPAKQYTTLAEVKQEICRILNNTVEAEGDEQAFIKIMSK